MFGSSLDRQLYRHLQYPNRSGTLNFADGSKRNFGTQSGVFFQKLSLKVAYRLKGNGSVTQTQIYSMDVAVQLYTVKLRPGSLGRLYLAQYDNIQVPEGSDIQGNEEADEHARNLYEINFGESESRKFRRRLERCPLLSKPHVRFSTGILKEHQTFNHISTRFEAPHGVLCKSTQKCRKLQIKLLSRPDLPMQPNLLQYVLRYYEDD